MDNTTTKGRRDPGGLLLYEMILKTFCGSRHSGIRSGDGSGGSSGGRPEDVTQQAGRPPGLRDPQRRRLRRPWSRRPA